ncbi:bud site selection protein 7-related [Anaeramoeba flamelloides]|uniref:Bud site selection protein 7-related n=1 Tax=Anaeramoeba flamelloides TaxID=1746091 RepID=A0AAV7YJM4_9EUKA|nr:bud site selection protein 7-related [Anaeramoeba flamelloides]
MEYLSNTCECVEEVLYRTVQVWNSQTKNITKGLGPHDLVHLIKVQPHQKKKKDQVAQTGFYHFVKGLNVSNISSVASYFGRILRSQVRCDRKRNRWKIVSGSFHCYNAFSRVDLVITYSKNGTFKTIFLKRKSQNKNKNKNKYTQNFENNQAIDKGIEIEIENESLSEGKGKGKSEKEYNNNNTRKNKRNNKKKKQAKENKKKNEKEKVSNLSEGLEKEALFEYKGEEIEENEILWAETKVSSWLRSVLFPKDFGKLKSIRFIQDFGLTDERQLLSSITKIFQKSKFLGCSSVRGISTLSDNYLIDGLLKYFFSSYRYTCGIKFFRVLAKKEPGLLRCVAKGYRKLGKLEKSLQVIRRGLMKKPSSAKMKIELIKILVALRKFKRALNAIDELETLAPFLPETWLIDAKTSLIDKNFHRMFLALSKIPWSNTRIPRNKGNYSLAKKDQIDINSNHLFQNNIKLKNIQNPNNNNNGDYGNMNNSNKNNITNNNNNSSSSSSNSDSGNNKNSNNKKNNGNKKHSNDRVMYLTRSKIDHYFIYPKPIRITKPPNLVFNSNINKDKTTQNNNNSNNSNNINGLINNIGTIYLELFLKKRENNIALKGITIQIYTLLSKFLNKVGWERFVELHDEVFIANIRDATRKKRHYGNHFGVIIPMNEHRKNEKSLLNEPSYDEREIIENEKKAQQINKNNQTEETVDLRSSPETDYSLNTSDPELSPFSETEDHLNNNNESYKSNNKNHNNENENKKDDIINRNNNKLFQGYLADLESEDNVSNQWESDGNNSENLFTNKNKNDFEKNGERNKTKTMKTQEKKLKSIHKRRGNDLIRKKALEPRIIPDWACYQEPQWLVDISEQIHYDSKSFYVLKIEEDNGKNNSSQTRTEEDWLDIGTLALRLGEIQKAHDAFLLAITNGNLKGPISVSFKNRKIVIALISLLSKNGQFIKALELSNLLLHFQDQKQIDEQLLNQKDYTNFFSILEQLIFKIVFQKGMSYMEDFIENYAYTKRVINTKNVLNKKYSKKRAKSKRRKKKIRLSPEKKIHEEIILFVQSANQLKVDGYQK